MASFLETVLLFAAALGSCLADVSDCRTTIEAMHKFDEMAFLGLSLASGSSLTKDAGKYVMCMNHAKTRYFLVAMKGSLAAPPGKIAEPIPIEIGFCVPDLCDHAGIVDLVNSSTVQLFLPELKPSLVSVSNISASSPQLDLKPEDAGGVVAAVVFCLIVLLVLLSSAIVLASQVQAARSLALPRFQPNPAGQQLLDETPPRQQSVAGLEENVPRQWSEDSSPGQRSSSGDALPRRGCCQRVASMLPIRAFSLFGGSGTLVKLIEIPPYKPTDCLNGMRVLSMAWIILGHSFIMPLGISGYMNQEDIVITPMNSDVAEGNAWFSLILGAQCGVDTFFFLSGFLLSMLTLKELRAGKMRVFAAIVLRYLRLTPSLALVMMVYYKIWVFFGNGPFAVRFQDSIISRCEGDWWAELTYTMNFTPMDSNNVCMGWSWYLGDDMIFFIISVLILPVYYKRKWIGWLCVLALTGASFGVTAWLVIVHNLSIYTFDYHYQDVSYWAYSKPWNRIPAYFVGLVAAWLLDELEARGFTRETRPFTALARIMAWATAAVAGGVLLFLIFIASTDFGIHKNSWGLAASVLYIVFSRPLWAMACAVLTLLCYYDYLPLVNGFLAHPWWTPLARLTYGAYLVHPLVIKLAAGRSLQYYTFNGMDMTYRFTGNAVLAFAGSALVWCLIERPAMTIFSPSKKQPSRKGVSGSAPAKSEKPASNNSDSTKPSAVNSSTPSAPPAPPTTP